MGGSTAAAGVLLGRGMFSEVRAGPPGLAVKLAKPFDAGGRTAADVRRAKALLREVRISPARLDQYGLPLLFLEETTFDVVLDPKVRPNGVFSFEI